MPNITDSLLLPPADLPPTNPAITKIPFPIPNLPSPRPKEPTPATSLPPIRFPPFFWSRSQQLIKQIEGQINSKLLIYFTYAGAMIDNDDVDYFFSHVKDLPPESSLSLVLISDGGSGQAAWRIANVLRQHCNQLTIIVPSRCASAATLLALSAEKILFGPAGYLTAIDTSLEHPLNPRPTEKEHPSRVSVDQINRVRDFINQDLKDHPCNKSVSEILFEKIHPVVLGELQRTSSLSKLLAKNMMSLRSNAPSPEEQSRLADKLNDAYPSHGYPIVYREAKQLGLPVEMLPPGLHSLFWEVVKLYSLTCKKVITNLSPSLSHLEHMPVVLESFGKRTFFSVSFDKRLMPQPGLGWVTENDKSRWLSATPDAKNLEKPKLSEIEL